MTLSLTLPKWYDLHTHFRQEEPLTDYVQAHIAMGCIGALAMPNTKPPVTKVKETDIGEGWSIEKYKSDIEKASGGKLREVIVPLYLTQQATPDTIKDGAASGLLKACKYYPPHGTTGAESAAPFQHYIDNGVFAAMQEASIVLCIHGEQHGLSGEEYFDRATNAEEKFYEQQMPFLRDRFPNLRIVCEHITTKKAVDFVRSSSDNVVATITPQHLTYTIGHLIMGLKYHLFCLPVLKHEQDRAALREAATSLLNSKFFAGTDSAPHTTKATDCGCAAGCFTGGIAPQLYAESFEQAGLDFTEETAQTSFKNFLCLNGPRFYGLEIPEETFTLTKQDAPLMPLKTAAGDVIPLPLGINRETISWTLTQ